jgi:hypothetical protein
MFFVPQVYDRLTMKSDSPSRGSMWSGLAVEIRATLWPAVSLAPILVRYQEQFGAFSALGLRLRRTRVEYAFVSVPMDANIMERDPEDATKLE